MIGDRSIVLRSNYIFVFGNGNDGNIYGNFQHSLSENIALMPVKSYKAISQNSFVEN